MKAAQTVSGKWTLQGYDTFEGGRDAYYPIPGKYDSESAVIEAARTKLKELEKTQPSSSSGGQGVLDIQDHIYIVDPQGNKQRIVLG